MFKKKDNNEKSVQAKITTAFTLGFAVLPAAAGSIVGFLFVFAALAGIRDICTKRIDLSLSPYDKLLVYPAITFFLVMMISIIRADFEPADVLSLLPALMFVCLYFVIKRYRYLGNQDSFRFFITAIPIGAFPLLIVMGFEFDSIAKGFRFAGGAGNPIPFAMIVTLMLGICIMNLAFHTWRGKLLVILAIAIFITALGTSLTRSMFLAFFPIMLISAVFLIIESKRKIVYAVSLIAIVTTCIIFTSQIGHIQSRAGTLKQAVVALQQGNELQTGSFNERIAIFQKGVCLAIQKPLLGHGIAKRRNVLNTITTASEATKIEFCSLESPAYPYTHFHNGFVTAFIDAGIFGFLASLWLLFAPIIFAVKSPNDGLKRMRIATALCLTTVYFFAGMTNILFGQDLIDAIFMIFCLFLALSVPNSNQNSLRASKSISP